MQTFLSKWLKLLQGTPLICIRNYILAIGKFIFNFSKFRIRAGRKKPCRNVWRDKQLFVYGDEDARCSQQAPCDSVRLTCWQCNESTNELKFPGFRNFLVDDCWFSQRTNSSSSIWERIHRLLVISRISMKWFFSRHKHSRWQVESWPCLGAARQLQDWWFVRFLVQFTDSKMFCALIEEYSKL